MPEREQLSGVLPRVTALKEPQGEHVYKGRQVCAETGSDVPGKAQLHRCANDPPMMRAAPVLRP